MKIPHGRHQTFNTTMKNFYFTFGQNHYSIDGVAMRSYFVQVRAFSYIQARQIFIEQFSSVHMDREDRWSMQYTERDFDHTFFPGGRYGDILQPAQ